MSDGDDNRPAKRAKVAAVGKQYKQTSDVDIRKPAHPHVYDLGSYLKKPEAHTEEIVYDNDEFVVIRDLYPKSLVHWLILPKSEQVTYKQPLHELSVNTELLESARQLYSTVLKSMAEKELDTKHGIKMGGDEEFVMLGVHSVPSKFNLHIHVVSRDLQGSKMRNATHYNKFATEFLAKLSEFPLDKATDARFRPDIEDTLVKHNDLVCLHCGQNFKRAFKKLDAHLGNHLRQLSSRDDTAE